MNSINLKIHFNDSCETIKYPTAWNNITENPDLIFYLSERFSLAKLITAQVTFIPTGHRIVGVFYKNSMIECFDQKLDTQYKFKDNDSIRIITGKIRNLQTPLMDLQSGVISLGDLGNNY